VLVAVAGLALQLLEGMQQQQPLVQQVELVH
jgi:hypothetical protein